MKIFNELSFFKVSSFHDIIKPDVVFTRGEENMTDFEESGEKRTLTSEQKKEFKANVKKNKDKVF